MNNFLSKMKPNKQTIEDINAVKISRNSHHIDSVLKHSKQRQSRKINDSSFSKSEDVFTIFSMEGCPFCKDAQMLLNKHNKKFEYYDYYQLSSEDQKKLDNKITKQNNNEEYKYFPRIFKNDKFIGGFGKLEEMLNVR
jgi:glutaredoxin